jgi:hypothetical protein
MPRDKSDGEDSHQRAILHVEVMMVKEGNTLIDVYSTHMSLSEKARNRGVKHLLHYANKGRGHMQVHRCSFIFTFLFIYFYLCFYLFIYCAQHGKSNLVVSMRHHLHMCVI